MAQHASSSSGTTLHSYNNELVKCIEDLREKREEVNKQILREEDDRGKIQRELSVLTERLQRINESLVRKTQARNEYDKTIQETEAAYMKIVDSAQSLVTVLNREHVHLQRRGQNPDGVVGDSRRGSSGRVSVKGRKASVEISELLAEVERNIHKSDLRIDKYQQET
eukprot:GHVS01072145.1.p1 GENE.GHVS01072145.1~~GHVS01072145.1.p1  ORF type:complete len:167 (+),score=20.85 GHVS01072145.1:357-857(+)